LKESDQPRPAKEMLIYLASSRCYVTESRIDFDTRPLPSDSGGQRNLHVKEILAFLVNELIDVLILFATIM